MGTGSGKEKMAFLQEDGKNKGAEVGKHRPSSGNVSRLAGLHLQELAHCWVGEQAGMQTQSQTVEF